MSDSESDSLEHVDATDMPAERADRRIGQRVRRQVEREAYVPSDQVPEEVFERRNPPAHLCAPKAPCAQLSDGDSGSDSSSEQDSPIAPPRPQLWGLTDQDIDLVERSKIDPWLLNRSSQLRGALRKQPADFSTARRLASIIADTYGTQATINFIKAFYDNDPGARRLKLNPFHMRSRLSESRRVLNVLDPSISILNDDGEPPLDADQGLPEDQLEEQPEVRRDSQPTRLPSRPSWLPEDAATEEKSLPISQRLGLDNIPRVQIFPTKRPPSSCEDEDDEEDDEGDDEEDDEEDEGKREGHDKGGEEGDDASSSISSSFIEYHSPSDIDQSVIDEFKLTSDQTRMAQLKAANQSLKDHNDRLKRDKTLLYNQLLPHVCLSHCNSLWEPDEPLRTHSLADPINIRCANNHGHCMDCVKRDMRVYLRDECDLKNILCMYCSAPIPGDQLAHIDDTELYTEYIRVSTSRAMTEHNRNKEERLAKKRKRDAMLDKSAAILFNRRWNSCERLTT